MPEPSQRAAEPPDDAPVGPGHSEALPAPGGALESEPSEPLGRAAAAGTLWLAAQKWVSRFSGLVTIAILTRLVSPTEFGVVAAASTITPFVLLLADLGFSTYLVQASEVNRRLLSTGFWFSLGVGAALTALLSASAPLLTSALNLPQDATSVLRIMPLSILLVVLPTVPFALMRRRMEFRLLAVQGTIAALVGQAVAIVIAVRGGGAWALVGQLLASQGVALVLVWRVAHWWPSREFSRTDFVSMAKFGIKVISVDFIASARATGEAAIISNVLGAAALGYMAVAQRLISVVQDLGAAALVPVSTVVFAKVREDAERFKTAYLRALRVSYAAVSPLLTVVLVAAPQIVALLFGPEWGPSVPIAQALSLAAILTLGAMLDHGLFYGAGQPGRWLAYAVFVDAITLAVTAIAAPHGITAVAVGFVVVALAATMARWVLVARLLKISSWAPARIFVAAGAAVVVSAAAGLLVRWATTGLWAPAAVALIALAVGIVHVLTVRLVSPAAMHDVFQVLPAPARVKQLAITRWLAG